MRNLQSLHVLHLDASGQTISNCNSKFSDVKDHAYYKMYLYYAAKVGSTKDY